MTCAWKGVSGEACAQAARFSFIWPGLEGRQLTCFHHTVRALGVADVFELGLVELDLRRIDGRPVTTLLELSAGAT